MLYLWTCSGSKQKGLEVTMAASIDASYNNAQELITLESLCQVHYHHPLESPTSH
jgi:hypothetical protein